MPTTFIEGFNNLNNQIFLNNLPKKNNVIFSANYHFNNDLFKVWLSDQISKHAKLVIGQHGGGPFYKYNGGQNFELGIADLYATTGNGNNINKKIRDVGQFFSKLNHNQYNPLGELMVVTTLMPRYVFDLRSMALGNQMKDYFKEQFSFYKNLPKDIKNKTLIRLPFLRSKIGADYGWGIYDLWKKQFPKVTIQDTSIPYHQSVKSCRILIQTYNSTTFCESLASNIPTVIFWNCEHWELKDYTKDDIDLLKLANIFHQNPESASKHVQNIWNDVFKWWNSKSVQEARILFCRKYANRDQFVEKRLTNILKEVETL